MDTTECDTADSQITPDCPAQTAIDNVLRATIDTLDVIASRLDELERRLSNLDSVGE